MEEENIANQAKLWSIIYGFSDSLVLRCAVELDIANIIHNHGKSMTLSELASVLPVKQPINSDSLYRVMRYLAHLKVFTKTLDADGETRYGLAPPAKFLVKGNDMCMVGSLMGLTDKDFMAPWQYIKDSLSGDDGKTAFEKALGMDIWEYMGENPEKNKLFNEAMACDTRLVLSALINECKDKFQGINSLVDVGGGTGTAARNLVKAFPHLKCTVYDLPHVIADSPVYPEINQVPGDMFEVIPYADAILMKCILHDWGDKECIEILKKCKEALPKEGGKVIIVDIVLDVKSEHPYTKLRLTLDVDMMLNTGGGKERTEEEWKKLIQDAGFKSYNITQISALQSVIEAFPY